MKWWRRLMRSIRGSRRLIDDLPTEESVQFILRPKQGPSLGIFSSKRGEVRSPGLQEPS
jgi:hypothetical protein